METQELFDRLEQSIARYDLLRHPFYQTWGQGELTRFNAERNPICPSR
jgi:pyrroloquinoline quinone (PQQ) biosynthesis protein C